MDNTPKAERLSVQLNAIAQRARHGDVTIGELFSTLKGSPYLLFTAIVSLPFLIPIPLFGLSTPLGIIIAIFGLRLTFGQEPWLPKSFLKIILPRKFFPSLIQGTSGFLKGIELVSRPRWLALTTPGLLMNFYGLMIFLSALFLLPPLPIPFTNFFPALTLILLCLGLIERDGMFVILGLISFVVTVAYFGLIFIGGKELLETILQHLTQ